MNEPLEYCTLMISAPRHMALVLAKLMRCWVVLADTCHGDSWLIGNACICPVHLLCHFRVVAEFL